MLLHTPPSPPLGPVSCIDGQAPMRSLGEIWRQRQTIAATELPRHHTSPSETSLFDESIRLGATASDNRRPPAARCPEWTRSRVKNDLPAGLVSIASTGSDSRHPDPQRTARHALHVQGD